MSIYHRMSGMRRIWTPSSPGPRWTAEADSGAPPAEARAPAAEFRCRVPVGQVSALARDIPVWRLDQVLGRWTRVSAQSRARPGEVLLVSAADGGYDPVTGFDPAARGPVPGSPSLDQAADPATGAEDAYRSDSASVAQHDWVRLDRHSEDVRDQAAALLAVIGPALPDGPARSAVTAAYLHDVGKAHKTWQDALCSLAPEDRKDEIGTGRPWAKSGTSAPLRFDGGVAFRHELASLLMLDGPLRDLLADAPDPDLARYLVLAHHGKLRVQVRDPGDLAVLAAGEASEHKLLGLDEGAAVDVPPIARPARGPVHRGPGAVPARRRALLDSHRARAARPVRPVRPRLPGDHRADRRLARQRRTGGGPVTSPAITRHACPGLRPEPLASYLAGLGLIRVLGEQADPAATAAWTPDGLVVGTAVPDLAAWLAGRVRADPGAQPVEQRQRLRPEGQGAAARAGGGARPSVAAAGAAAGGHPRRARGGEQGSRQGLDHRRRDRWRQGPCRAGVPKPLPGCPAAVDRRRGRARRRATRSSRRCSAPAGTTVGSTSPPTSTSACST